ncbi:MAG: hypothetical protein ABJB09_06365 [Verrucomicrobiota bacterium]
MKKNAAGSKRCASAAVGSTLTVRHLRGAVPAPPMQIFSQEIFVAKMKIKFCFFLVGSFRHFYSQAAGREQRVLV